MDVTTLQIQAERFLAELKRSPQTVRAYRADLRHLTTWLDKMGQTADAAQRGIPVVVLSTSGEAADRAACRDADEHLRKPGSLDGLVALLRELGRRWLRPGESA